MFAARLSLSTSVKFARQLSRSFAQEKRQLPEVKYTAIYVAFGAIAFFGAGITAMSQTRENIMGSFNGTVSPEQMMEREVLKRNGPHLFLAKIANQNISDDVAHAAVHKQ